MIKSVLVVGLDGATWKVLNPLLKSNKLPFLKSLIDRSAHGILESTIPPLSAPSWVTFQTGVNPAKHGIFEFLSYRTKDGIPVINSSREIRSQTIWHILGEYKLKSLIINMPLSYPVKKMNGVIISSFLTPVGATFAYPKHIENILNDINYEIDLLVDKTYGLMPDYKLNTKDRKYYLDRLIEITRKRVLAYEKLSKIEKYSFQFLLFKECDVAQHLFWDLPELSKFYISIDKVLADLYREYQKTSGQKNFIVISDHGFHKAANKQFSPYVMIQDLFETKKPVTVNSIWQIGSSINKKLQKYGIYPSNFKMIKNVRDRLLDKGREELTKKNKIIPTFFGIYLLGNDDRQKSEKVKLLLDKLKEINKKHKIFDLITQPHYLYKGSYLKLLPEIIWKVNEKFTVNTSPYATEVISQRKSRLLGDHEADPFGVYITNGKNINIGKSDNESITDIPLLVLKILGIGVPWYFDGTSPKFYREEIDELYKLKISKIITEEIKGL